MLLFFIERLFCCHDFLSKSKNTFATSAALFFYPFTSGSTPFHPGLTTSTRNTLNFSWKGDYHYFHYSHVFSIVTLSNGSVWLVINRHSNLKLTSKIYISTQNGARINDKDENFYINNPHFDFFLITGSQREATTCRAYPLFSR